MPQTNLDASASTPHLEAAAGQMPDLPRTPSFRQFLELPISTQPQWSGYEAISEALNNLSQAGWYQGAALLCDATYMDDRIVATMNTRANSLFSLPQLFKYQGEGEGEAQQQDRPEVVKLKQAVTKIVEDRWEEMFPGAALREMLRWGIFLNAGVGENVWRWDGNMLIPTLKTWNPQFIYWRWDTRSNWLIHAGGQVELQPGDSRWVFFAPFGHNHGQLYGLIRSLAWLWMDRTFTFRNWARAIEKFSLGVIKAFMPADGNEFDKARFAAGITNMPHEATVTLPVTEKGNKFDLEMMQTDSAVNWQSYVERIKQLDASIAISILGQNLTTEAGGHGASGSRAAARVHDQIRMDIVRADAEVLESTLKTQVLAPFVYYNFAADAQALGIPWQALVPNVTWNVDPPEDQMQQGNTVAQLASALSDFAVAGAPVDTAALLEKFDIPVTRYRAPDVPPPGLVNERPRLPNLMPTDLPSPDFREYPSHYRPGERDETSQAAESPVEGGAQFGNPAPLTDDSGNVPLSVNSAASRAIEVRRLARQKTHVVSAVAAFDPKGRLLIQRRRDSGRWCCPAGGALAGEDPKVAARRELKEETGLSGTGWKFLGRERVNGKDIYCYRCQVDGAPSAANDPDQEASQFAWIDPKNPPTGIKWHHDPDVVASKVLGAHAEHQNASVAPEAAAAYQDEQRPLWSQFARDHADAIQLSMWANAPETVTLAVKNPALPRAVRAGQVALDDLVDMTAPSVAKLLGKERDELVRICADCASYSEMRQKIRAHFKNENPVKLRALITKAVGLAEQLGRQSVRGD